MKKALVHDWFSSYTGAERCVESMTNIWDDFDFYTLIDTLSKKEREKVLKGKRSIISFIEKLPFGKKKYRSYLALFPLAIEQFDLSEYELIISSSSSVAKGVLTRHDQLHISYVHSPIRYAWDLYFQYLEESGLNKGFKGIIARYILHKIRTWDYSTAHRPDFYIANSNYIASRIKKIYNKDAMVIYPPVDVEAFQISNTTEDYYITCSRMVPYKKVDLIVKAFNILGKRLIVIGDGPDYKKIKKMSSTNIELMGNLPLDKMVSLLSNARAFIFAAEEDFGIAPVEAQASGLPVIAYGKGGALETIKGVFVDQEEQLVEKTGIFFKLQTKESIIESVYYFEKVEQEFDKKFIRNHAKTFSRKNFETNFKNTVLEIYSTWKEKQQYLV